ncbi:MAG: cation diffusion facilitator family transporter [Defluviitaleaceae bacterium]|nr:cation diffusion facilitator family transporter [Defluviitaleaceae bacterium]
MTNLLLKIFVKDYQNTENQAVREKYGVFSSILGIVLNLILFVLKFVLGIVMNSVAVTADAFNNLTDCASSLLSFLGFKIANRPADKKHPFGYGRTDEIISLIIAGSILLLGYEFIRTSITNILVPVHITYSFLLIALLAVGSLVKVWLFIFNRKLGKAINSATLKAISIDSLNDAIITGVTFISIAFTAFSGIIIDGFVGVFVALMLIRSGYNIAKDNLNAILGNPVDKEKADQIKEIVSSFDGIVGVHDLIIHSYGHGRNFATIHAEVANDTLFHEAHILRETAEKAVLEQLNIYLTVALDLSEVNNQALNQLKERITSFLAKAYPTTNAHDFRITNSEDSRNFAFELEVPHDFTQNEQARLVTSLEAIVTATDESYNCIVNLEYGYIEQA